MDAYTTHPLDNRIVLIRNVVEGRTELDEILANTPWRQDHLRIYGKSIPLPRLQALYGDAPYTYSGVAMTPLPWSDSLSVCRLRNLVEFEIIAGLCGDVEGDSYEHLFNACLVNRYRNGMDHVSPHADDEPELDPSACIASLSLGADRDFVLKNIATGHKWTTPMPHGSVLVMGPGVQQDYLHWLPQRRRCLDERVNLTFRRISRLG